MEFLRAWSDLLKGNLASGFKRYVPGERYGFQPKRISKKFSLEIYGDFNLDSIGQSIQAKLRSIFCSTYKS